MFSKTIISVCVCAIGSWLAASTAQAGDSVPVDTVLRVHEWGTFTALQNEHGEALPGINIDDEPVPAFCHNLGLSVLGPAAPRMIFMKGLEQRHPDVTLRLETPVLYFHPPAGAKLPFTIDVDVEFHGGWLTEFYPQAKSVAPGFKRGDPHFDSITPDTVGTLGWHHVEVGTTGVGPETTENVWLAPRKVQAASVTVPPQNEKEKSAESEKYLFYRGVGHRAVPLAISHDETTHMLSFRGQCADVLAHGQSLPIASLWLVHTRRDGAVAFRPLDPISVTADTSTVVGTASSDFAETDYSAGNLHSLREQMHHSLISQGLFPDEATAMLDTWQRAYFQSPGLRVFFLVPRTWTDSVLPLKLSQAAEITRVMMGRIELVSPEQRALLRKFAGIKISDGNWISKIPSSPNAIKFYQGRSDFGDLGVKIPDDYQAYLDLGRFRNALILQEQRTRPTPAMNAFITTYELAPAKVTEVKQ